MVLQGIWAGGMGAGVNRCMARFTGAREAVRVEQWWTRVGGGGRGVT